VGKYDLISIPLSTVNIGGLFPVEKVNPDSFQETLKDRTGIIFFKDYWRRGNEPVNGRSGDHIDLWN